MKPNRRPQRPEFSSGPCAKRPGWSPEALLRAPLGRSHRSKAGKERLQSVIDRVRLDLAKKIDQETPERFNTFEGLL